jgi:hypothetical protein
LPPARAELKRRKIPGQTFLKSAFYELAILYRFQIVQRRILKEFGRMTALASRD